MKSILNKVPKKIKEDNRNIYLFREEDDNLIIQATHVIYILKDIEKEIYKKINDQTQVKEIIEFLSLKYGVSKEMIVQDVIDFLKQLENKKLIKFD